MSYPCAALTFERDRAYEIRKGTGPFFVFHLFYNYQQQKQMLTCLVASAADDCAHGESA
jgi:hypothetical protein